MDIIHIDYFGGKYNNGTLYVVDPSNLAFKVIHHFNPYANRTGLVLPTDLIAAGNDMLVGVGRIWQKGAFIFEYNLAQHNFTSFPAPKVDNIGLWPVRLCCLPY